ncbi:nitroreductase family protein [Mycoplasmatota bacterium zrk1]
MIKELIKSNRTVRKFKETKLNDSELFDIVEVARYSMSARNIQELKFKIINDERVETLFSLCRFAGYLSDFNPTLKEGPKSFLIVCVDTSIAEVNSLAYVNAGIAMANITLVAKEKGFSSVILGAFDKGQVVNQFNIDEKYVPIHLIGFGEADEKIHIVDYKSDIKYYRDKANNHYVPKRCLEDLLL